MGLMLGSGFVDLENVQVQESSAVSESPMRERFCPLTSTFGEKVVFGLVWD